MFKFCPKCKSDLSAENNHLHCAQCGFDFYLNQPVAVVLLLINSKKQIYLDRRAMDPGKGTWEMPGGFIEPGETAEEAIKRETLEELGIELGQIEFFGSYPNDYEYKGTMYHPLDLCFISRTSLERLDISNEEIAEGSFFDQASIPFDQIVFPSFNNCLRDLIGRKMID